MKWRIWVFFIQVRYGQAIDGYFSASRDKEIRMWKAGHQDPVLHFSGHELVVNGITLNQGTSRFCIFHDSRMINRDIFNEMKFINIKYFAKYCPFMPTEYPCFGLRM